MTLVEFSTETPPSFAARPDFSAINYSTLEQQLDSLLEQAASQVTTLQQMPNPDWQHFIEPLEAMDASIEQFWSPVSHLNSVMNSDELREVYNTCREKLQAYWTALGQNTELFQQYQSIQQSAAFTSFSTAQQRVINNAVRDFTLSGVSLDDDSKKRFTDITLRLGKLTNQFSENVLDATNAFSVHITDLSRLAGLPAHAIDAAALRAKDKSLDGWLLNLEFPTYYAVMTFAEDRSLRESFYVAWSTRGAASGPHSADYDNTALMSEILSLRAEKASLLGFDSYSALSVETKMVESADQVINFLLDLGEKSLPSAKQDIEALTAFTAKEYQQHELEAWDIGFYSDKLKKAQYAISDEDLKPYFPATVAIPGMFSVISQLFGISITKIDDVSVWHPDVEMYQIRDKDNRIRGEFYLDTFARENKRGGAWMDVCVSRRMDNNRVQLPIAYLTCNLTPPVGDQPALLTHNEVTTLFHEFGHGLHHMLTLVDYASVSGISGVEWDAVELPSQFLENWCWEREALDLMSGHVDTGEKLPDDLLAKMNAARHFQSALFMVRQLEFALFDMRIHTESTAHTVVDVQQVLNEVRERVAAYPVPEINCFQNSFSHIFAGGYAAGYFSYKWAEVLSADAYSLFEEQGIFNAAAGESFMRNILEKGGTQDAMQLFEAFRGRAPTIDALLRHSGLAETATTK